MAVNGIAAASTAAGAFLIYAGITGKDIPGALRAVVTGQGPSTAAARFPITGAPPGTSPGSGTGTGGGGGGTAPSGPGEKAYFTAMLAALLAPPTAANLNSLSTWRTKETPWPPVARNNALNTTLNMPGATDFNSVGVKNYPTAAEGILANARTLMGGYPQIVAALRAGRGVCGPGFASEFSTWSGGGYTEVC